MLYRQEREALRISCARSLEFAPAALRQPLADCAACLYSQAVQESRRLSMLPRRARVLAERTSCTTLLQARLFL